MDVFKPLVGGNLKKLELSNTDASKNASYRNDLFKTLQLEAVDGQNATGEEVESTIYDEGEELDDDEDIEGILRLI